MLDEHISQFLGRLEHQILLFQRGQIFCNVVCLCVCVYWLCGIIKSLIWHNVEVVRVNYDMPFGRPIPIKLIFYAHRTRNT